MTGRIGDVHAIEHNVFIPLTIHQWVRR